jgi:hypothetical protein
VYSLIELISEVSGLADIFNLGAAFFMAFYTRQIQRAELVSHTTTVRVKKRNQPRKSLLFERDLVGELGSRFRPGSHTWLSLTAGLCPKNLMTRKQARYHKLQDKATEQIDQALDISRTVTLHEDVQLLLESIFTPTQLWLFKAHQKRLLSLK